MQIYEEYQETVTRKRLIEVVCDWCGTTVQDLGGPYNTRTFCLEFTAGNNYPDGGWEEGWQVEDLCDDCVEKLKTLLVEAGITVAKLERDW